jgi:hypothetical protein
MEAVQLQLKYMFIYTLLYYNWSKSIDFVKIKDDFKLLTPLCLQASFRILGRFSGEVVFVFEVMCTDLVNGLWFGLPCCKDMLHFLLS